MRVSIQNLVKKFGDTVALKGISLEIQSEELFFLLGPSGCGKTTLLRTLAGFYQPDEGQLLFGERPMAGVPPHQRNTGMVFQNYALWPHMTVEQNVTYGLDIRNIGEVEKRQRVQQALEIVQMQRYAARTPDKLSGGQQQRVALARALVIKPDVLLLDEPLSNLDAKLRLEMREEIRRIHQQTRITTVYVTHDQKEALSLANRMAVLRDGRIEQIGDPRTIYRAPANPFVADFIGETNWLEGTVEAVSGGQLSVRTAAGQFHAPASADYPSGSEVLLGFRPESVEIGENPVNGMRTKITHVCYLGEIEQYELELPGGQRIKAFEQNPDHIRQIGAQLPVVVRPQNMMVLKKTAK